jgi:hypothetical protein
MLERERRIYARCVRMMVEGVEGLLDYKPGKLFRNGQDIPLPSPFFCHDFRSDLEDYAEVLEKVGILLPLVDPPGLACCFRLICGPEEAELLAFERAPAGPPLPRMLASLFYFAGDKYGMTSEIGIWLPTDCYAETIMPDMCDLGYAERTEQGYRWLPRFKEILEIQSTQVVIT